MVMTMGSRKGGGGEAFPGGGVGGAIPGGMGTGGIVVLSAGPGGRMAGGRRYCCVYCCGGRISAGEHKLAMFRKEVTRKLQIFSCQIPVQVRLPGFRAGLSAAERSGCARKRWGCGVWARDSLGGGAVGGRGGGGVRAAGQGVASLYGG